ncbi:MAG: hypothetical protein ACYC8T_00825 [Myxococcaceae bacterium]
MRHLLVIAAVLSGVACSEGTPALLHPCVADGGQPGGWIAPHAQVLSCREGPLSLALTAAFDGGVPADGHSLVTVSAALGRSFELTAAGIEISVSGGSILAGRAADSSSLTLLTGETGRVSAEVRVGSAPGPLVLSARSVGQSNALDAGTGLAAMTVSVDLLPAELSRLSITTENAALTAGLAEKVTLRGWLDADYRWPGNGQLVELCLDPGSPLVANSGLATLSDGGAASVTIAVPATVADGTVLSLRACPATAHCGDRAACDAVTRLVHSASPAVQGVRLSIDAAPMRVGDSRELSVVAYADPDFTRTASEKTALAVCAGPEVALAANFVQLDGSGRATTRFTATAAGGSVQFRACPLGLDCSLEPLPARCGKLERVIAPPADALGAISLGLGAQWLTEDAGVALTVLGYSDSRRTIPAGGGLGVRLCVDPQRLEAATAVFLSSAGRADSVVVARSGSSAGGPLVITACPYADACTAPSAVCESIDAGVPRAP